jgi:predicted nucleic acid-binding protein
VIVIDAATALTGLINAGQARQLLGEERVCAPETIDVEVANGLRRSVSQGRLGADAAGAALQVWGRLGVRRFTSRGLLGRMWALCEVLDGNAACYVALAEALDCALVTTDLKLGTAEGVRCPVMIVPN